MSTGEGMQRRILVVLAQFTFAILFLWPIIHLSLRRIFSLNRPIDKRKQRNKNIFNSQKHKQKHSQALHCIAFIIITGVACSPVGIAVATSGKMKEKDHQQVSADEVEERKEDAEEAGADENGAVLVRHLINQGMKLLARVQDSEEEQEDLDVLTDRAIELFNMAVAEAKKKESTKLEAEALQGLACAFAQSPARKLASPVLFEMAAELFIRHGQHSDAISSIVKAGQVYCDAGDLESAIKLYSAYDEQLDSKGFLGDEIGRLVLEQARTSSDYFDDY